MRDAKDDAILKLKEAEERNGDPEITKAILSFERRMSSQVHEVLEAALD